MLPISCLLVLMDSLRFWKSENPSEMRVPARKRQRSRREFLRTRSASFSSNGCAIASKQQGWNLRRGDDAFDTRVETEIIVPVVVLVPYVSGLQIEDKEEGWGECRRRPLTRFLTKPAAMLPSAIWTARSKDTAGACSWIPIFSMGGTRLE